MSSRSLIAKIVGVAAVTIAAFQGYRTLSEYLENRRREKAATSIQKWFRNNLYCYYNFRRKRYCAIKIQRWWRREKAREKSMRVYFTQEKWNEMVKIVKEDVACTTIQAWWKARKKLEQALGFEVELPTTIPFRRLEKRIAAVIIQSWWRMTRQRRRYLKMKARILQARLLAEKERSSTVKVQSQLRMRKHRQMYLATQSNTLKVESRTRGYLARRQMDVLMESLEKEIATIIIQSWWKMNARKRWFSAQRREVDESLQQK